MCAAVEQRACRPLKAPWMLALARAAPAARIKKCRRNLALIGRGSKP